MTEHLVSFDGSSPVSVRKGSLLTEAATAAGVYIAQPCGGQGRCGRCAVQVTEGQVRRRSTVRLSEEDLDAGFALACQSLVEGNAAIHVPEQETLDRHLASDRTPLAITVPSGYDPARDQSIRRVCLTLPPPTLDDQRDDWSRLQTALGRELEVSLPVLRKSGNVLREGNWEVTLTIQTHSPDTPAKLLDIVPGLVPEDTPLFGLAIDIGTTTVSVWLVDLLSGTVLAQAAEYNRQIRRGEDVISRVIYASKNGGAPELRDLVLQSIDTLIDRVVQKASGASAVNSNQIMKATVVGNSIMIHLLLGIPAESIRLSPFVTTVNHPPTFSAREVGLGIHPEAEIICLPGVASYVGADITAGVLSSGLDNMQDVTLFMDVGTNGEIVLGCRDWLVTCACSAGPAFEGAGVHDGMRATQGAIEEVWIDGKTCEPTLRVIGDTKPRGLCGSGLISLLAEMFLTGVVDKGGHLNQQLATDRIRQGGSGPEYVVAWGDTTWHGEDIVITHVDIDNLIRAKAAIYAGISVLADSVGVPLETTEQVLIGGSFGKYINVEKGVQIGLLPDAPWEQFKFLGNTAVLGAYYALLSDTARARIEDIASRMTYIELSADNSFYEAFMSALFLPHTDMNRFPSVQAQLTEAQPIEQAFS